jgi:glutamine amidotransferase
MTKLDLVDVGGGNIGSVKRCLERLEIDYVEADLENPPNGDRPVLLPGVGAFGPVMDHLAKNGFDKRIKDLVNGGTPFLGICVGMQILFDSSEESKGTAGLGLIPGVVRKYKEGKVPQIGWNLIERASIEAETKPGVQYPESGYVYFVNSYYPDPSSPADVLYASNYHVNFCAAVQRGNITAFQFHPEKSGEFGKILLRRWVENVA